MGRAYRKHSINMNNFIITTTTPTVIVCTCFVLRAFQSLQLFRTHLRCSPLSVHLIPFYASLKSLFQCHFLSEGCPNLSKLSALHTSTPGAQSRTSPSQDPSHLVSLSSIRLCAL